MFDLSGKVALVTGASRGLGKGIALALAEAGADVIVNYMSAQSCADEVVAQITSMGRRSIAIKADVSSEADVDSMFETIVKEFGRLDILVNNAGTTRDEDIFETTLENWKKILDTNLTSAFLCSKNAMKIMKEQKAGRIIQISSIVGQRGALYGHVHYGATKSGQVGFSKTLARTAAPYGITVNSIAPGLIGTELLYQTHGDEEIKKLSETIPLGLGTIEDVGAAAVYLASDEARYMTGATLDLNGGMNMR
jgi:3-oxoacyl-[acyl-carrier protein] reductase